MPMVFYEIQTARDQNMKKKKHIKRCVGPDMCTYTSQRVGKMDVFVFFFVFFCACLMMHDSLPKQTILS